MPVLFPSNSGKTLISTGIVKRSSTSVRVLSCSSPRPAGGRFLLLLGREATPNTSWMSKGITDPPVVSDIPREKPMGGFEWQGDMTGGEATPGQMGKACLLAYHLVGTR